MSQLDPDAALPPSVRGRPCFYDKWRVAHCAQPGEHIVFMGDSLTRYQWLALAASFHRRVELSETEFPSLVKEREWRHWMPFYNGSTEALKPNSRCDCHRSFARPVGSKTIENRYFWLEKEPSSRGDGQRRRSNAPFFNLSFIQVLTPEAIMGQWKPVGPLSDEAHRDHVNQVFAPNWRLNWQQVMREVVAKLQPPPTVIVLNMGLWSGPPNASYAAELERTARTVAPRVVWKTTTRMRKSGSSKWLRTDLLARRVFHEVFDAARLTRHLDNRDYWDPRHFLPHVYNHLNAALLAQLYGPPAQCDEFSHGKCIRGREPTAASAPGEAGRAEVLRGGSADEGWTAVARRQPSLWSPLQTLMWVDSLGIAYDAKAMANRGLNGSTLSAIVQPGATRADVDELGLRKPAQLAATLRALELGASSRGTTAVSPGRRGT